MKSSGTGPSLSRAISLHQSGRLVEAEQIYRDILAVDPNNYRSLHLLGALASQTGRNELAVEMIGRAAELKADDAIIQGDFSQVLRLAGKIDLAISAARKAVALDAKLPSANDNLGLALIAAGRTADAIEAFRAAINAAADFAPAHANLGAALLADGKVEEAATALARVVQLQPQNGRAYLHLARAFMRLGKMGQAHRALHQVVEHVPQNAEAWHDLAMVERAEGKLDHAIGALHRAIHLRPDWAQAHELLAIVLADAGRLEQAVEAHHHAISLKPNVPEFYNNLGVALCERHQFEDAQANYRKAIELHPNFVDAHMNLAHLLLLGGDFPRGWKEFEWRKHQRRTPWSREYPFPNWAGEELAGRSILIRCDAAGFGDTIQFVRFAPLLTAQGVNVILESQPELIGVMRTIEGIEHIVSLDWFEGDADFQFPLMSLAGLLKIDVSSIPSPDGYIKADSRISNDWNSRLGPADGKKRVGLCFSGADRALFHHSRRRSAEGQDIAPLAGIADVEFHLLQKNSSAITTPVVLDHSGELTDFSQTAGLMANLDGVITIDTAVAHLAGAMGKRVWLALPFAADWRWLADRDDSPWYSSMRIFRQTKPGEWKDVFERIAAEVAKDI